MVTVKPTLTFNLENGQRITLDLKEAKELIKILNKVVHRDGIVDDHSKKVEIGITKKIGRRKNAIKNNLSKNQKKLTLMSGIKQREILGHVNKRLSSKPMTLSSLLKGVSYTPNHLPYIRSVIEDQPNIAKQIIGKRIYYSGRSSERKQGPSRSMDASSSKVAAVA